MWARVRPMSCNRWSGSAANVRRCRERSSAAKKRVATGTNHRIAGRRVGRMPSKMPEVEVVSIGSVSCRGGDGRGPWLCPSSIRQTSRCPSPQRQKEGGSPSHMRIDRFVSFRIVSIVSRPGHIGTSALFRFFRAHAPATAAGDGGNGPRVRALLESDWDSTVNRRLQTADDRGGRATRLSGSFRMACASRAAGEPAADRGPGTALAVSRHVRRPAGRTNCLPALRRA